MRGHFMAISVKALIGKILAGTLLCGPACATVTVTMSGTTQSSSVSGTGNTFTATMVYDDTATNPTSSYSGNGYSFQDYAAVRSMSFSSGSVSRTISYVANNNTYNVYNVVNGTNMANGDAIYGEISADGISYIQAAFTGLYSTINTVSLISPIAFMGSPNNAIIYAPDGNSSYYGSIQSFGVSQGAASVPEPATWTMMIVGFGAVGSAMRRQRARVRFV